jgi:hypothetical protein
VSSHADIVRTEGPLMPVSRAPMNRVSIQDPQVGLVDVAELHALFAQVTDPRRPRGVRHHIATVLTVMVFAVLVGAPQLP